MYHKPLTQCNKIVTAPDAINNNLGKTVEDDLKLELAENLTIPPLNDFSKMVLFSLYKSHKERELIVNMCTKYSIIYLNLFPKVKQQFPT